MTNVSEARSKKEFADIDAWPICLDTKDPDEIVRAVKTLAPGFGGINLEDISAPLCLEIEEQLKCELDIPVFHDDQQGTAIVVLGFPGIFRGALDCRAREINEEMKPAAAEAIAGIIVPEELHPDYIVPGVFNREAGRKVAEAVIKAAVETGVAGRERLAAGREHSTD